MTVPKHLNEAAAKLKEGSFRIDEARQGPVTCENQKLWLEALTDTAARDSAYNLSPSWIPVSGRLCHSRSQTAESHRPFLSRTGKDRR
jgi:hypothetical protein